MRKTWRAWFVEQKRRIGVAVVLVGCGTLLGWGVSQWQQRLDSGHPSLNAAWSRFPFPAKALHASATDSNENFAVATGTIDEDVEGLYLLDAVTGELQCVVLNHRSAKFNALFRANVASDLGVEQGKKPEYLLVTGIVNFRGSANARPARSVAYVVDATTGKYAAYGVPWRREFANQGRGQTGVMPLLHVGSARAPNLAIEE